MDEEKIAREIEDCDGCPLYGNDCPGGWTGGPNGPIEPPCCSWNGDEEISKVCTQISPIYRRSLNGGKRRMSRKKRKRGQPNTKKKLRIWN